MKLSFTKMHSLGNDFMVIDAVRQPVSLSSEAIQRLADRHCGVGFDQCLLLEKSPDPTADFFYRIFNADGQEVGQCGNGARCIAQFAERQGLLQQSTVTLLTRTTRLQLTLEQSGEVTLACPPPVRDPAGSPCSFQLPDHPPVPLYVLDVGNPQAVMPVTQWGEVPVAHWGKIISEDPLFPEQTNVVFMEVVDSQHLRLRVYERGCGETLACGSGALAAGVIARNHFNTEATMHVELPGGTLTVRCPEPAGPIYLTGPVVTVYEGACPGPLL